MFCTPCSECLHSTCVMRAAQKPRKAIVQSTAPAFWNRACTSSCMTVFVLKGIRRCCHACTLYISGQVLLDEANTWQHRRLCSDVLRSRHRPFGPFLLALVIAHGFLWLPFAYCASHPGGRAEAQAEVVASVASSLLRPCMLFARLACDPFCSVTCVQ